MAATLPSNAPTFSSPPIGLELLTKCGLCGLQLRDALRLNCSHVFCKQCLLAQNKAGKLECPTCRTVNIVQNGDLDKTFKPSMLSPFWVKLGAKYFDQLELNDAEKEEHEGLCPSCQPPPGEKKPVRKGPDGKPIPEPEPLKVKLSLCFHCGRKLCEACRNKHYHAQRQEAITLADNFQVGSGNIAVVCEKLNESRTKKLMEYDRMKADIAARKREILQSMDAEEKELIAKIDSEIMIEKNKMKNTDYDSKRLASSREAVKSVREKLASYAKEENGETNKKKLSELCKEFTRTQEEWKTMLQGETTRNDPSKEKRIVFSPTKDKEQLIGMVDQKKENLNIKQANVPSSESSSVCTII